MPAPSSIQLSMLHPWGVTIANWHTLKSKSKSFCCANVTYFHQIGNIYSEKKTLLFTPLFLVPQKGHPPNQPKSTNPAAPSNMIKVLALPRCQRHVATSQMNPIRNPKKTRNMRKASHWKGWFFAHDLKIFRPKKVIERFEAFFSEQKKVPIEIVSAETST